MHRLRLVRLAVPLMVFVAVATVALPVRAGNGTRVHEGDIGGAPYRVEVPSRWNGTLLLWSHGAYGLELPPPSEIALMNHPATRQWLLDQGYALAASQYRVVQGWGVVESGLRDQIALLDWFGANVGEPRRTVSAGASAGGLIALLLAERHPGRFAGVASLCGVLGGTTGHLNSALDANHAIKTLLAPDLELVRAKDPDANAAKARQVLTTALDDPRGRARLALAGALADVPGRYASRAPAPASVADQVRQQYFYAYYDRGGLWGADRADIETRAGGNPSWNTGVDHRALLARSSRKDLVKRAYREAGLKLGEDLERLNAAPRVQADPRAVAYLDRYGTPRGRTPWPVVTLHSTDDGTVPVENQRWYAERVRRAGDPAKLRQLYVDRGYHCTFTASEEIVALRTLLGRMDTGRWGDTRPASLNKAADAFGPDRQTVFDLSPEPGMHPTTPAFTHHRPGAYLRP
ncbi:alpha/beta hydrolase [Actinomadura viridis]|uniref:Pimeloyl-ACP methyl ester carboxylesterase n=1 Tax=Actinomadura viridis TaxID=58110 RepID=A0A931DQH4_9ACTN|nr:prolyl oligopeptidase family serine peptidase [Actinomadura viridis]MBG6091931.1 pimeloyl-ACP methyl ester carboxylesterase [Actinomadura viridis]